MSWQVKRKTGYILEEDLEYPQELHDKHNSYPLAPETTQVPEEWYSPYQRSLARELNLSKDKTEKLIPTLNDKTNYVLHYRNFQLYLKLGMKLKKVHNVLAFDQKDWMESYIRLNTEPRKKATSDFEKNFFKLMNNSVFGKTMENLRNRTIIKLVRANEQEKLQPLTSDLLHARSAVFAGIHEMHKDHFLMNKPAYTGMSVLELSKNLMHEFYYLYLEPKYGSNCQLLYTDTDSLLLEIKTEDVYKDMKRSLSHYDTRDFPKDHPLHSQKNKKVIGKMKDECAGEPISEAVCPRSKMYSIWLENEQNIKKAKGTTKVVTKKEIQHQHYKDALFKHGMDMLRSKDHQIYGGHLNKTTLSPFVRLKAVDYRRRHLHVGIRSQRYRRQLSVWRHNHQLLTEKAPPGPIVNIIHNRLIWFGNNPFNVVDLQRPDWISRSPTTLFQCTRLVKNISH